MQGQMEEMLKKTRLQMLIGFHEGSIDHGISKFKESDIAVKTNMFDALQIIHAC